MRTETTRSNQLSSVIPKIVMLACLITAACSSNSSMARSPVTLSEEQKAYINVVFADKTKTVVLQEVELNAGVLWLKWAVGRNTGGTYASFINVLDANNALLEQNDSQFTIKPNSRTTQVRNGIPLFANLKGYKPSGIYQVQIGIYDVETGKRLPFIDSAGGIFTMQMFWLDAQQINVPTPTP